jgi:hypothetical protein
LNEFYTTNQPTFSNLQAYKNYEEEHIQDVKKLETKIIGTMLNILQSDKIALLNLNHNFIAVQFIAKYKLKQCHGHIETKS